MAQNQSEHHQLGRAGEIIARRVCKGRRTGHKHPFDYVDHFNKIAYEVKTMNGAGADLKVHIENGSYERKLAYAKRYGLKRVLVIIVIHSPHNVDIYTGELKQHVRISKLGNGRTTAKQ